MYNLPTSVRGLYTVYLTMRYAILLFFIIISAYTICCAKRKRLALWIDEKQIDEFIGYKMHVFIISDGNVVGYMRSPTFGESVPVIPPQVDTVNLTWEGPADTYTYWFDDLKSLQEDILYQPLLSIPISGVVPEGPKIFQMSIPCTGKDKGIAALILGLQVFDKHGRPIRGSPIKLKLKKRCDAFVPSTLCQHECMNGGRCNQLGHCECVQGFEGLRCERSMCDPGCENNGTCMSPKVCICPDGYSGERCERALCKDPCQHGGRCIQEDVCWCTSGFLGNACQFSKCNPNCQHGGVCIDNNKCSCPVGFTGPICEKRKRPKRGSDNTRKRKKKKRKNRKKGKRKGTGKGKTKKNRREKKVQKNKNKKTSKKNRKKKKSLLAEVTRFSRKRRRKELKRLRRRQRRRRQRRKEQKRSRREKRVYVR